MPGWGSAIFRMMPVGQLMHSPESSPRSVARRRGSSSDHVTGMSIARFVERQLPPLGPGRPPHFDPWLGRRRRARRNWSSGMREGRHQGPHKQGKSVPDRKGRGGRHERQTPSRSRH